MLDCVGGFRAGDPVYISFRTSDGSQFVIAAGIASCDELALRRMIALRRRSADLRDEPTVVEFPVRDAQLLWPPISLPR